MQSIAESGVIRMRKQLQRELALSQLQELGVFLPEGHFDYGNGWHGSSYLNPHVIFHEPYRVWQLAQDLLDQIPGDILAATEMVVGPQTGGSHLAFTMAPLIHSARDRKDSRRVYFAPIVPTINGFQIRDHYQKLMAGKRVLLADDVRNTGKTQRSCANRIAEVGGIVIATAQLFDRMSLQFPLSEEVPNFTLAEYALSQDLVPADRCAQCKLRQPITQF